MFQIRGQKPLKEDIRNITGDHGHLRRLGKGPSLQNSKAIIGELPLLTVK